jgi:hypothetical protein
LAKAVGGPARGLLLNLLISVAPIALLVLFYLWLLKRQSGLLGMGGGMKFQPVDPEKSGHVQGRGRDRRSRGRNFRGSRFPEGTEKVSTNWSQTT